MICNFGCVLQTIINATSNPSNTWEVLELDRFQLDKELIEKLTPDVLPYVCHQHRNVWCIYLKCHITPTFPMYIMRTRWNISYSHLVSKHLCSYWGSFGIDDFWFILSLSIPKILFSFEQIPTKVRTRFINLAEVRENQVPR